MRRVLKYFLLTFIFSIFFIVNVKAIEQDENTIVCNYDDLGLQIIYYKNINEFRYILNYEGTQYDTNFGPQKKVWNFYLLKWGKSVDTNIEISSEFTDRMKKESACPTGMYVGVYNVFSIEVPSAKDGIQAIGAIISSFGASVNDNKINEQDAVVNINAGSVFITSYDEYQKKYAKLKGNNTPELLNSKYREGVEDYWDKKVGGIVGSMLGGGLGMVGEVTKYIWDLTLGDGVAFYKMETVDLIGVANYIGPNASFGIDCPNVHFILGSYKDSLEEYKKCSNSNCKIKQKNILNQKENSAVTYCNKVLSTKVYNEDGKQCITSCLNLTQTFNLYKKGTDLYNDDSYKGNCGFSDKLLAWIMNIMRWIKYLVPILLIVLSIMDFIKALSSDKEDEMKKAQKHFVTRLIVAVLIFIAPLIIEFILDKMGFGIENCGIGNIGLGK